MTTTTKITNTRDIEAGNLYLLTNPQQNSGLLYCSVYFKSQAIVAFCPVCWLQMPQPAFEEIVMPYDEHGELINPDNWDIAGIPKIQGMPYPAPEENDRMFL